MCQKSIENLVSLLEEEEAAEARRRPKVIKTILYLLYLYNFIYIYVFGCESSPISPNVRSSVSALVR